VAVVCSFAGRVSTYFRTDPRVDFGLNVTFVAHPFSNEGFGASLSLCNDTDLLVGAPITGSGGVGSSGRAYRYTLTAGGAWEFLASYVPTSPTADSDWGFAVAMGRDGTCVVSSTTEGGSNKGDNGMYIYLLPASCQ
jgi:hypothetical protein